MKPELPAKIAIIKVKERSRWFSCNSISSNLLSTYKLAFPGRIEVFFTKESSTYSEILSLATKVRAYDPNHIVFLDHQPHPLQYLQALKTAFQPGRIPYLFFHVFGDFTLFAQEWMGSWFYLRDTNCWFIAASNRQKNLVSQLLGSKDIVSVLPFQVNTNQFFFSPSSRKRIRLALGLDESQKVFIYSGRLSMQKNISLAIQEFAKFAEKNKNCHLFFAGEFDDLGAPLFGWHEILNRHFFKVKKEVKALNSDLKKRIRFFGNISSPKSLNAFYNSGDALLSFSLHHDEDFGMAAAEGMCTGLPMILTSWGGYQDFLSNSPIPYPINVSLGPAGLRLNRDEIQSAFHRINQLDVTIANRQRAAQIATEIYSPSACVQKLKDIHISSPEPFRGFSSRLAKLSFQNGSEPMFQGGPKKDSLYQDVYAPYYD